MQKVARNNPQAIQRTVLFEIFYHIAVGFHGHHFSSRRTQVFGEHTFAGTYFHYTLIGLRETGCNAGGNVVAMQEMLAIRFFRFQTLSG